MSWPFVNIAVPFAEKGLELPNLNVLTPDARPYEIMAIQPSGPPTFRDDFIGHSDRDSAERKFSQFIDLAIEKNADLVLSPEYSCPWPVIRTAFDSSRLPQPGKLWVLGCESITRDELDNLVSSLPDIMWIYEEPAVTCRHLLDVILYVLKTEASGQQRPVAVLQFKTVPMAGDTFERDHLIPGTTRYVLHNSDYYLQFVTIVCSEALEFQLDSEATVRFSKHPSIVFHPQLIDEPRHPDIRRYREQLYGNQCSSHLEVLTLNWAREFKAGTDPPSIRGNSAIFMKSDKFDRSDQKLHRNHILGAYYSRWQQHRTDICVFNFDEHIFHFGMQKVNLIGSAVEMNRTGPEMYNMWYWNEGEGSWEMSEADDGFRSLCNSYSTDCLNICLDHDFNSVDRERMLTLSAGTLNPISRWYEVDKMQSYIAEADERTKRLTFVHEENEDSRTFRNVHITRFIRLQSILADSANFPETMLDLRGQYRLIPPRKADDFRFNIVNSSTNDGGATVMFVGTKRPEEVRELREKISLAWGQRQDTLIEERSRRLVIWYEHPVNGLSCEYQPLPEITDDSEVPSSITGVGST